MRGKTEILAKDRTEVVVVALNRRLIEHGAAAHKDGPPKTPGKLQGAGTEWSQGEVATLQSTHHILQSLARLRRHRDQAVIFEIADGNGTKFVERWCSQRNRRADRVNIVLTGKHPEEQGDISHSTRHRSDRSKNREG